MLSQPTSRYRFFLFIEFLVVLTVLLLFRWITDRLTAGAMAGGLFLFSTVTILVIEWIQTRRATFAFLGGLVFLFGGVLPILALRWLSWGEAFETAELMGIAGGQLHRTSNLLFLVFLIGIYVSLQRVRAVERNEAAAALAEEPSSPKPGE